MLKIFGTRWQSYLKTLGEKVFIPNDCNENGELSLTELYLMAHIALQMKPRRIFEIGTFRGTTVTTLAMNTPEDAKIYTLDLPYEKGYMYEDGTYNNPELVGIVYKACRKSDKAKDINKITQLWGDSTEFDFSPYYDMMDLVFVDGGHDYDTVSSDAENAGKMINKNGVIIFHDFALWKPSVVEAVYRYTDKMDLNLYIFQDTTFGAIGDTLVNLMSDDIGWRNA